MADAELPAALVANGNKNNDNSLTNASPVFSPPPVRPGQPVAHLATLKDYQRLYAQSIQQPEEFWGAQARKLLSWHRPFTRVLQGGFQYGDVQWFGDGELNVSYNCIDRHAERNPDKVALIWESDEPGHSEHITYGQLLRQVCQLANVLQSLGVGRGDSVAIYMPMVPEAAYAMLACARIGAVHSAVFAGFSAESLRDRINDAQCKVLLTADQGKRGGKAIQLKQIADTALVDCPSIEKCLVYRRTGSIETVMHQGRDLWWHEELAKHRPWCPPTPLNAEDPLFFLYTSGSTGKPKGLMHTQAGYLLGATLTLKYTFDLHEEDIFGCVADVGWITGHSYIVYGPLSLGITTVIFESVPTYPQPDRYWQMIDQHKITHFYTAPTAIRALKRFGDDWVAKYQLDSLRVLGTVGEPINPEAWQWYYQVVGRQRCAVVDTYWQTETGSFVIAPYAPVTPAKPGSATLPQFGIEPVLLDSTTGQLLDGNDVSGVLCLRRPWPSMARTVFGAHERYLDTYFRPYKGYYFTGDGAHRDKDGYYWILGRVDDVINVSGHRISTAEIESALVAHPVCAEAAVIGIVDDVTGQAIVAFCTLKASFTPASGETVKSPAELSKELVLQVRKVIGPFASPKRIVIVPELPKTRSGKIMRRILRKIASNEVDQLGDTSTLADPAVINHLIEKWNAK